MTPTDTDHDAEVRRNAFYECAEIAEREASQWIETPKYACEVIARAIRREAEKP